MARLILAEDSVLLREGLVEILTRSGHRVLAAVADADALLAEVEREPPDVVVTDVRMPPGHLDEGLRAALHLRNEHPRLGILVLSQYVAVPYAAQLLSGRPGPGGTGYLLKDRLGEVSDFLEHLDRVTAGHTVIDPEVVRHVLAAQGARAGVHRLSARERDVLALMAQGLTNADIGCSLVLTESAVVKHVGNIFTKLGLGPSDGNRRVLAVLRFLAQS